MASGKVLLLVGLALADGGAEYTPGTSTSPVSCSRSFQSSHDSEASRSETVTQVSLLQSAVGVVRSTLHGDTEVGLTRKTGTNRNEVSLMVNVAEVDAEYINVRLSHLMKFQQYPFKTRCLIVDTRGRPLARTFSATLEHQISLGLADSWKLVNYSEAYVRSVRTLANWTTDFVTRGHAGNLVYYYMLDACPTRYCAHFDLDVILWSKPSYSWISEGIALLSDNSDALTVLPPYGGTRLKSGSAKSSANCRETTFITARKYLMHADRYRRLLEEAMHKPDITDKCGGDRHWEQYVSCASCMLKRSRILLLDSSVAWSLHMPYHGAPERLESIMHRCADRGIAIAGPEAYNAAPKDIWLKHACMTGAAASDVSLVDSVTNACIAEKQTANSSTCVQRQLLPRKVTR